MTNKTENAMKIGGAVMAVGTAAAITAGVLSANKSTKSKMKKMAKKTVKAMDGIMNSVNSMMK